MNLLDKLGQDPYQQIIAVLPTGERITLVFRYMPAVEGWFIDATWANISINGLRLVTSDNLYRSFRNLVPFGLSVTSTDTLDPMYIDDFTSGRIKVYSLTKDDVATIESLVYGG